MPKSQPGTNGHPAATPSLTFPRICPNCARVAGIAITAEIGRRPGSVDVLVHCGNCHHQWLVKLPGPKRS